MKSHSGNMNMESHALFKFRNATMYPVEGAPHSIEDILLDPDKVLASLPVEDRYNVFFTPAQIIDKNRKRFHKLDTMYFDIDKIGDDKPDRYIDILSQATLVPREDMLIINSGHGIHVYIRLKHHISHKDMKYNQGRYNDLCALLDARFRKEGLVGKMDRIFNTGQLMRVPNTVNHKPPRPDTRCGRELSTSFGKRVDWNWDAILGADVDEKDIYPMKKSFAPTDTEAVLNGCEFLKHCKSNASTLGEPAWKAMIGTLAHIKPDGEKLCHEYSVDHPEYTREGTDRKIRQSLEMSGPWKCESIGEKWDGCSGCEHYQKITTPLQIVGPDHITTEESYFRDIVTANGKEKYIINYEDMLKAFRRDFKFKNIGNRNLYIYKDTHYIQLIESKIENIAQNMLAWPQRSDLFPKTVQIKEFVNLVYRNEIKDPTDFSDYSYKNSLLNFRNGVFNYETLTIRERTADDLFLSVLDYDYDPSAICPRFEKYLAESFGDEGNIKMVLEFVASGLFAAPSSKIQRNLVLYGTGENGKSLFLDIIRAIAGENECVSVNITDFDKPFSAHKLAFAKFNLLDEGDSSQQLRKLKSMASGASFNVAQKFKDEFEAKMNAKVVLCTNKLILEYDSGKAEDRRLLQVTMQAIPKDKVDTHLLDKIKLELPGIFNILLKSFVTLQKNEFKIQESDKSKADKEENKFFGNDIYTYAMENLIHQPGHEIKASIVHSHYLDWARGQGTADKFIKSNIAFGIAMKTDDALKAQLKYHDKRKNNGVYYFDINIKEHDSGI